MRMVIFLFWINFCTLVAGGEVSTSITDVHLTVSSLVDGGDRRLELNWRGTDPDALVALYDAPPDSSTPLVHVVATATGYFRTKYRLPEQVFTKQNLTGDCLGFWIAVLKGQVVFSSSCMRAHPNWMFESRHRIANFSLLDLMLPGSHNAGCYSPFRRDQDNVFSRYLFTQEESIFNQLAFGIRYLDLRVGYYTSRTSPETLWITHSSFRTDVSVREALRQVKEFLEETREVVILDFHRFVTGFKGRRAGERHRELLSMLEEEVGELMVPVSYTTRASLDLLWSTGKRLYVGYSEKRFRTRSRLLFPAVKHLWGDVDDVRDLWSYLNETVCETSRSRLTSAMVQLTPTTAGVLFNTYGGLRQMAAVVNRQVAKWFGGAWQDCANIISTDFILGNGIVELAIATNQNKSLSFHE